MNLLFRHFFFVFSVILSRIQGNFHHYRHHTPSFHPKSATVVLTVVFENSTDVGFFLGFGEMAKNFAVSYESWACGKRRRMCVQFVC